MRQFLMITTLVVMVTVTLIPAHAQIICSSGAATVTEGPTATVGHFASGSEQFAAQTFTLDCSAQILSLGITLFVGTSVHLETQPLAVGDTIQCKVLDAVLHETIMTSTMILDSDASPQYLEFDFSGNEFELDANEYVFMISFPQERWGWVQYGSAYDDGEGYYYLDGSWLLVDNDFMFDAQWNAESGFVSAKETPWGALKANYR